jgi:cellulose synthase/poly-beta-1,6-N-acetylglucosamine synthase-like glycosyltransferase
MLESVRLAAIALVAVVAMSVALASAYVVWLTLLALVARKTNPPPGPGTRRFAVLVPAHNEEPVIGRLLRSLSKVDYPAFDVCVVADNCDDRTAEISRSHGALVFERFTETDRAKGFALKWLLAQLRDRAYDAYVVLDADTVVEPSLLRSFDARLEAGGQVIQAYYTVLNASASPVAGLRFAALAALHYLRPLGRSVLGLSVGLKGNGMCFAAPVLERFAWNWFTLAEDVEFHLALVRAGLRVDFAHETSVRADMPVTLAQARSQNERWERGRIQLLRAYVPALLLDGLRSLNLVKIDAAIEQLLPPLSVPVALGGFACVAGLALGSPLVAVVAGLSVVAQLLYLAAGLALVGAPMTAYVALTSAPIYVAWKFGLYAQALVSNRAGAWIRTSRVAQ